LPQAGDEHGIAWVLRFKGPPITDFHDVRMDGIIPESLIFMLVEFKSPHPALLHSQKRDLLGNQP
jgi:hypothetical protein